MPKVADIRLSREDVWVPDISLYNMIEVEPQISREKEKVSVSSSGELMWVSPYHIRTSCTIDTFWFPFDDQECLLKFGSWTYNGFKLDLQVV